MTAPSRIRCIRCNGPISDDFVAELHDRQRKLGRALTVPRVCAACVWDALESFVDDLKEEESQ